MTSDQQQLPSRASSPGPEDNFRRDASDVVQTNTRRRNKEKCMNAIQQLMVAIISVVLGATSTQVFNQLTVQETKILFWVSMLLLVSIFMWSAAKASWKKNVRKRPPPKKRKPKRSKRRAKPP